ncbi:hypothetical protein CN183_26055 [Sinorhizobium medicae]|nr:hypothetical protein CN183_26055 [Sinorhizobium medicae]
MTIRAHIDEDIADLRSRLVEAERERDEAIKERDRLRRKLAYVTRHIGLAVDEMKIGLADRARRRLDRRGWR